MRREIQQSQESLRALAARLGVNPKTVAKWRGRRSTQDARKGPKRPVSTVLNLAAEALIVVYRRRMLSLSEIKFEHTDDAVRRELMSA
jgi:transposase-like protein